HATEEEARDALADDYCQARPVVRGTPPYHGPEVRVLTVPAGPSGQRLLQLAREALPEAGLVTLTTGEDVLFYREIPHLPLAALEQLGPVGYETYRQMTSAEHFTPHTRIDITEWRAATVGAGANASA